MRLAASRTFCTAGKSKPIRIAMMAITTSSSISVKPRRLCERAIVFFSRKRRADSPKRKTLFSLSEPVPRALCEARTSQRAPYFNRAV
jgi:hypothetical protein